MYVKFTESPHGALVSVSASYFENNTALSSDGGAISVFVPTAAPVNTEYCAGQQPNDTPSTLVYRAWQRNITVAINDSTFINNTVPCRSCSGGALAVVGGASVLLATTNFTNNTAGLFGGALSLGVPSSGSDVCSVDLRATRFTNNGARNHGGGQFVFNCAGDVSMTDTVFTLRNTPSEVSGCTQAPLQLLFGHAVYACAYTTVGIHPSGWQHHHHGQRFYVSAVVIV